MTRVLILVVFSVFAQENHSCFPNCEPLQCTGLYGPRVGPQERWTETAQWLKARVPTAFIDERIVMAPGRFGDQVTSAADMIRRGEILLRLPVQTFLLEEDCFPTEAFSGLGTGYNSTLTNRPNYKWNASKSNGADFTQAGLCLLIHRLLGNKSSFEGYIRHLPRQSSGETYMFRSMSDLESLKGSDAYRIASVVKRRHMTTLDSATGDAFAMIRDYFPHLNWTTDEFRTEFQQTLSLCGSRTFNLDSEMLMPLKSHTKLYRPALVPLLDMLNHGDMRTRNCQYYFNTTGQYFQLQAIRDITAGEELVHSYGARSNAELLLFYGFMMDGNIEDFVAVADLTAGAIDYNFHTRLGHSLRCHTPYFRPVEGSAWPPKFQAAIKHASPDDQPSSLSLGPLEPSVYYSFAEKLKHPQSESVQSTFADLARSPGALLKIVDGEFVVTYNETANDKFKEDEPKIRGDLIVSLVWKTNSHHSSCVRTTRPRCEDFAPGITSVSAILSRLQQGLLPAVARVGGCFVWSERKQLTYEIKLASDGSWTAVVTEEIPQPGVSPVITAAAPHEADLFREFQFKRYIIRTAGLEEFASKLFRTGLLQETLIAVRIAVLPVLSSFAIHGILSGNRFTPDLEQQVARTLLMFCFEELSRRLQVLGVDSDEESFPHLLYQARTMSRGVASGSYATLARNQLGIVHDFCSGVADWGLPIWERGDI